MADKHGQRGDCLEPACSSRVWRDRCRRAAGLFVVAAWAIAIGTGMYLLWGYAHARGAQEASPARWPQTSQIPPPHDRPLLLFFAHPRCPCTRASIRELERLTTRIRGNVDAYVIFTEPSDVGQNWSWTDLRESAEAIPAVHVVRDRDGVETELFSARTSGLALLFSDTGTLLFQGGITAARGHEGDNDGVTALESILLNQGSPVRRTPVFGCPLQSPELLAQRNPQR